MTYCITCFGYYYDTENGLYYLNSRYYDPEVGRFISADSIDVLLSTPANLTDKNLYAYCDDNPVSRLDNSGQIWHIVVGGIAGGLVGGIVKVASNIVQGKAATDGLGSAVLAGAASGALAGTGVGILGVIAGNTAIAMVESATSQYFDDGSVNAGEVIFDGVIGGAVGAVGGKGTGTQRLNYLGKQVIKRTMNKVEHKSLSAGLTEFKKASSYYIKNTRNYYAKHYSIKPIGMSILGSGVNAMLTSDYMKGKYVHWIRRNS